MSDGALSAATRILRPEVASARYRVDGGRFWRDEIWRDGRTCSQPLPRAPRGAQCWASDDAWHTCYLFTVGPRHGRAVSTAGALFLALAALAVPGALLVLPGSVPAVAALAGLAVTALCLAGFAVDHLAARDPRAAARLGYLAAADLTLHTARAHRHRDPR